MQPEEPYPSLSLQCMSAPALTSAIAVSVWQSLDALCSAVLLHSQSATPAPPPRMDGPSAPHCGEPNDIRMQPEEPYPSLSLQCTSAPALTSAIAVSVWQFHDAECSIVLLHSQSATTAAPPRVDGPSAPHCGEPNDTRMQPEEPYPSLSLQCTSAPALTSAIAVSVWPLNDAL